MNPYNCRYYQRSKPHVNLPMADVEYHSCNRI